LRPLVKKINVSYYLTIEPGQQNTASFFAIGQFHNYDQGGIGGFTSPPFEGDLQPGDKMNGHLEKYSLEAGRSAIEVAAVNGRRPFIEAI
jgi:hypothetical protein